MKQPAKMRTKVRDIAELLGWSADLSHANQTIYDENNRPIGTLAPGDWLKLMRHSIKEGVST